MKIQKVADNMRWLLAILTCIAIIPIINGRIQDHNNDLEPLSADMNLGNEGANGLSGNALKTYLKELDKYVAIAGRPRFGRSSNSARMNTRMNLLAKYLRGNPSNGVEYPF